MNMGGGIMICSMSETAKMLGYYKVEAKSDVPRTGNKELSAQFEAMSDEELQHLVDAGKLKAPA